MNATETRARLLEETRQACDSYAGMKARLDPSGAPEPGDVFTFDSPGDFVVEWVILERDPAGSGRVLAVPADGNPLRGSADVALSDTAPCGPLILRCRLARWLDASALDAGTRAGRLAPGDVARARQRWSEIERGTFTGSVLARERDEDPDYQDWVSEVLVPARQALAERSRPRHRRRRGAARGRLALIAASVLLAVAGSLAGGLLWRQHGRIRTLLTAAEVAGQEHRQEIERLAAERVRLAAEHRRELAAAGQRSARAEDEYRGRLAELDQRLEEARRESAVRNPVLAALDPAMEVRGKSQSLRLPPRASHVLFFVPLTGSPPLSRYRIELVEKAGRQIWAHGELTLEEPGELRAGVPASLLAPGDYRLRVLGLESGQFRLLREHAVRIEGESP